MLFVQRLGGFDPTDKRSNFVRTILGRKPQKVSRFGASPVNKAAWRLVRSWVCHNHKLYYTYVILCAFGLYQFWWYTCIGYYRRRNHHRSLPYAQMMEKEWQLNKPKDEDEDYGEEVAATATAGGADDEE